MSQKETTKYSICYMCTFSCPMRLHIKDGRVIKVEWGSDTPPIPCPRWKAQIDFVYHPDRLKYPLKRTGARGTGEYTRITWQEALDTIAENLLKIKQQSGPESVAFWIAYTKEPRPYFHRLTHAFGSPNYMTESSSCASSAMVANTLTYGTHHEMFPPGAPKNPRCILLWSSSVQNSNPALWTSMLKRMQNGLKLIVVDPRRTKIAEMAEVHLQNRPGTDGALALSLMHVIIKEKLHDLDFIRTWTTGFEQLEELVKEYTPEYAEKVTWVPADKIRKAAILFATTKPATVNIGPNSTTHHTNGLQNHRAIILLPAITGNLQTPYTTHPRPMLNDITLHERVNNMPPGVGSQRFPIWTKIYGEMQSNALADQIESGTPYPIKALFSSGLDLQFFPNSRRFTENINKLDFIAVCEYFLTPGAKQADIVLPIASWWEREILLTHGVFGPFEKIRLIQPAIQPVGECLPEWAIYSELAHRLGFGDLFWDGDFSRCVDYILQPSGISYEMLKKQPDGIKPEKIIPAQQSTYKTPSGKIEIASSILAQHGIEPLPEYVEPPESPLSNPELAKHYPLVLTTGARVLAYVHSQYRNIKQLQKLMPHPLAEINTRDAGERGIKDGDWVVITSLRGTIRMKAKVTDSILKGVVSIPHHWPGNSNANLLVDDKTLDPISGFPPFKSQLCQVAKAR